MISFLGIIGTVIGFLLLAGYLILINNVLEVLTLSEILILSSVLCATDTVAANSLIKAEKFPVLNAVLFGEGILNDAVAIILFGTVSKMKLD
jgi:NhaP-type Na+/H+ or K+/H+ antiporter